MGIDSVEWALTELELYNYFALSNLSCESKYAQSMNIHNNRLHQRNFTTVPATLELVMLLIRPQV